jgi:Acetyltransferases
MEVLMKLKNLDHNFRSLVNQYIKDEWGGPNIVTRGHIFDSSNLPGFVVVDGETLMGAVIYQIDNGECEIAALFSLVESKGVGTALINAVVEKAKRENCKRVWLITTNDNTHAIRFYQKRGLSLAGIHLNAINESRRLKPQIPLYGIDNIPILHEVEFERVL